MGKHVLNHLTQISPANCLRMDLHAVAGQVGVVEEVCRKFWVLRTFDYLCECQH